MKLLLLLLGFGLAIIARGQGAAPTEPRLYVGLQGSYMHYPGLGLNLDESFPARTAIYPAMGTVGYRLANDLWIEASFTAFSATRRYDSGPYFTQYQSSAYAASLLVRGRLTDVPRTSPWAVDIVGGLVRLSLVNEMSSFSSAGSVNRSEVGIKDVQLALGVGGRYHLSRYWQLTADAQGQLSVIGLVINSIFGSSSLPVGGGLMAGSRYSF